MDAGIWQISEAPLATRRSIWIEFVRSGCSQRKSEYAFASDEACKNTIGEGREADFEKVSSKKVLT